ncbi:molybdopterin-binding protein [Nitratidesulfovibrio liaohensis]|uniref:Molybdopterin molybdenumtransferase n=1 Tax=Nitratidesulfovibrio liaohensis TaxID=2604158 RepID=A0ABY9R363_9BACT|nr:molybdopterin-binding protein [Nitratidesulfovibrio liaohensis]WMW66206.1 molybdopterin-binding protein [Nitratidesulfovibrio liaohensis]
MHGLEHGLSVVPVHEAVGMMLCHDMTRIIPGVEKGPGFRKGHIIAPEDIPLLLQMGKEHVYALRLGAGQLHEDDAAMRLARVVGGAGVAPEAKCEGRVNLVAEHDGLLHVDVPALGRLNGLGELAVSTLHGLCAVRAGQMVAGMRVIPLIVHEQLLHEAERALDGVPVVSVLPFRRARVGMVTTGSEVFHGRIKDKFGPVVRRKFADLGSEVVRQVLVADDRDATARAIRELVDEGADMVVVTGGMSVDPDDQTPAGIRAAGARVVAYGAPVLPGSMFMLAYLGEVPVMGLPGCVMYHRASIFDLVAPRLLAGLAVTREDITALGHGGLCLGCQECRYPACPFGKGA